MPGLFSRNQAAYRRINIRQFDAMLTSGRPPFVVDVREPFELTAYGRIPGVVNIPLGTLPKSGGTLPKDKSTPIIVVCQSGNRSLRGAEAIARLGYTDVASLDGGTIGWLRAHR